MKVTLAWPADHTDYLVAAGVTGDADETVDIDDNLAARLIADGRARTPDSVGNMSGDQIVQVAAAEGVDLSEVSTVADKRSAVKAARAAKEG